MGGVGNGPTSAFIPFSASVLKSYGPHSKPKIAHRVTTARASTAPYCSNRLPAAGLAQRFQGRGAPYRGRFGVIGQRRDDRHQAGNHRKPLGKLLHRLAAGTNDLAEALAHGGHDGLYNSAGPCGCLLGDLAPCGGVQHGCLPGRRVDYPGACDLIECDDAPHWHVEPPTTTKAGSSPAAIQE